ncbi:MAG: DegT/DnrJ/EryC1/StrS family aminotransferase [Pegethrix bostrychoides GSE-TBD4-15B]|jgi:dTDP-4-amino-4,6-dideoxygalactose transaminase|uniref:DegT/DnrJ/EryC1/StrS family aminotransferase n=1 Tax=Pegethrix bostrychoides GSE-TBD4-15B TaxID=2839662 RepID=A0A951P718_9CYAN|nr:DegT/DnrJ/EryC1/StrS family aminotransferase [Pegethrix bostrychoides GSE-TBD4-15B]
MKDQIDELAVFGGTPAFQEKLYVGRPNIGNREQILQRIADMLDRRWLSNNGLYVQDLEKRIAKLLDVKHCIAICNATVALEITSRALDLTGEVIVPSFTFIATAHALQWQEITPVFCDIDPVTHCLNPWRIESMITPRTTGIVGVHLWGHPCNTEALTEVASKHNLKLMFDASHAFGCSHNGTMIGNFGDAEVFSFHATKFINAFEGGAVVTNNDDLATKIRLMKNFGFAGYDNVTYIGVNGKMNEACAAMALTSLESLDEFTQINYRNYKCYQSELAGIPGLKLYAHDEAEKRNYQYIVVEMEESVTQVSRDQIVKILHAENVMARRYFYPGCHRMEPYRSYFPHAGLLLPETERLTERVLVLPTGTAIDESDIRLICKILRFVLAHGISIRKQLQSALKPAHFAENQGEFQCTKH